MAVTVALMLVGMAPLHLPNYASVAPALPLMALYYWVIHRPDLLRPSLAFGLGLLQDLLSGTPLGMTPMIYVLVYWGVLTQRRFFLGTSFAMLWFGFALIAFGAGLRRVAGLFDPQPAPPVARSGADAGGDDRGPVPPVRLDVHAHPPGISSALTGILPPWWSAIPTDTAA